MFDDFLRDGTDIVNLVTRSCERAARLISSFKQVAVDQTSEQRRSFDVRNVIQDVVTTLTLTFRHDPWVIAIDIAPGLLCDSYPGALGQVATNLIQNAVIHAFAGRDHGTLHISAVPCPMGFVELHFSDDGCGMDSATLARIFDPFFTTRLGQGGSGLGLSVSRNLTIGVLGGTLTATSAMGQGTCFVLSFPCVAPTSDT